MNAEREGRALKVFLWLVDKGAPVIQVDGQLWDVTVNLRVCVCVFIGEETALNDLFYLQAYIPLIFTMESPQLYHSISLSL